MEELIKNLTANATDLLIKLVVALFVLIIGFRLIAWLEKSFKKEHKFSKLDKSVKGFLISFVVIALKILLVVIVLSIIGVPMASLVTIIGSCAVAIGLALQGGLSNIAGGLMILIFKPFKVGDYIAVTNYEGTVKSITMFYTTIITVDNKTVQLPNGSLSNNEIVNYSSNDTRRVDLTISVSYKSKIDRVKEILNKIVSEHELIMHDEEITIRLKEHADSSLVFVVRVWTKTENYWKVYFDLMETIKEEFDKHKIEIPYPQLDVHLNK